MSGILNIKDAARSDSKVVICLAGQSGSGKTFTALQLALGMTRGNPSKIGFLDAENNRGLLYSDTLPKPFKHANFTPPFHPLRYVQGIKEFEEAGVDVLIIDSGSHEWEGIGGCHDIAHDGNPKVPRWNLAKREHLKFVNCMLQCSMHIIVCLRAKEKTKVENHNGKTVFVPQGLQPICEGNFMFEMTASVMMHDEGQRQDSVKVPEALKGCLGRNKGYITSKDGEAIMAWVQGGKPANRELESCRATLANSCADGAAALKKAWEGLTKEQRKALDAELPMLKASAESHDKQRAIAQEQGDTSDATAAARDALAGPAADDDGNPFP